MKETKFTPGPWEVDPTGDLGPHIIGTADTAVAEVFTEDNDEEWKVNACLIAAAPDLLAALLLVLDCPYDSERQIKDVPAISNAIQKATSVPSGSDSETASSNPK